MKLTDDPRQADLPETAPDPAGLAKKLASEPMRPNKPQVACDVGLFSDDTRQIDLEDLLDGTSGQDRDSYSDTQDRDCYSVEEDD